MGWQTPEATRRQICLPTLVLPVASAAMLWVLLAWVATGSCCRAISRLRKQSPWRLCNSRISDGTCTYLACGLQISVTAGPHFSQWVSPPSGYKRTSAASEWNSSGFHATMAAITGVRRPENFKYFLARGNINNNNCHSVRLRNILTRTERELESERGRAKTTSRNIMMAFTSHEWLRRPPNHIQLRRSVKTADDLIAAD